MSIAIKEKSKIEKVRSAQQVGHRKRLRERLLENGGESLLDYEIVELMLFLIFKRKDTKPLAKSLLEKFGTIDLILSASKNDILDIEGAGEAVFTGIKIIDAVIKSTLKSKIMKRSTIYCFEDVLKYCEFNMKNLLAEEFRVIFLNTINQIIGDEVMQRGTINSVDVAPREIVRRCIEKGAKGFILVHNHPSGDPTPSAGDVIATKMINDAAKVFNIDLYDHIIIGGHRHISFKNLGLLK